MRTDRLQVRIGTEFMSHKVAHLTMIEQYE